MLLVGGDQKKEKEKKRDNNRLQAAKDFTSVSRKRTVKFSYVYSQTHL